MLLKHLGKNTVIVVALIAAGFFVAWLRFRPHLGNEGRFTDGQVAYDVTESSAVRYAVWEAPRGLPGDVNSVENERRPALSPDGRLLVFVVGDRRLGADLYVADLVDGVALDPRPLAAVNSEADEWAPSFAGGALYFASDRLGSAGGLDLWRAPYDRGTFADAERIAGGLNTEADETDPVPVPGTDALVFASNRRRPGRLVDYDLYLARPRPADAPRAEGEPPGDWIVEPLEALNSRFDEREPAFTVDGRTLFFASDRADGAGGFDLYRSALGKDGWVTPVALVGINGVEDERGPLPTRDGFELLFGVEDGEGADLYQARSIELFRTPGRPVGWLDLVILAALLILALLAWLAKRWDAIDVLYKCFLISLVAHLLLLLYFTDVFPEEGAVNLRGEGNRIRVRLLSEPSGPSAALSERGGALEVARAEAADAQADPGRHEAAERAVASGARAAEARAERAAAALLPAPERAPEEALARTSSAPAPVAVHSEHSAFERLAGGAPSLALEAAEALAPALRSAAGSPERTSAATDTTRELAHAAPASRAQERAGGRAALPDAPRSTAIEAAPRVRESRAEVALVQPVESFERREAGAPALALAAPDALDAVVPSAAAGAPLARAGSAAQADESDPLASRAESRLERSAPASAAEVALQDRDAEGFERRATDAPVLTLDAAPALAYGPRDALDPRRQDTAAPDVLDARVPSAAAGAPLARASDAAEEDAPELLAALAHPQLERGAPAGVADVALQDRDAARFERLAAAAPTDGALPDLVGDAAPLARAEPDPGSAPTRAAQTFELEATALQPSADARLERADLQRDLLAPPSLQVARDLLAARPRDLPAVAVAQPDDTVEHIASSTEQGEVGLLEVLDESLLGLASAPRAERALPLAAPQPARFDRDRRDLLPDAAPGFRPLAAAPAPDHDDPLPLAVAQWEHTPYQARAGPGKARAIELHGGSDKTEAAVAAGLAYLADHQKGEGFWGDPSDFHSKYRHVSVGKTGLAMLAFLGASHTHQSNSEYSRVVARAVAFLRAVQDERTGHFGNSSAYSHAIATYALAECHALTGDKALRPTLERATAWILAQQDRRRDPRLFGGWGYYYPDGSDFQNGGRADTWPRASVTAWQVMALESARLGGLEVPDRAFADARVFLKNAWDVERGAYRYSHDPDRLGGSYAVLPGSTPASLFALSLLGEDVAARDYRAARRFVMDRVPDGYRYIGDDAFVHQAVGNLYFYYYGTLAMFRVGGRQWEAWNTGLKQTLLPAQNADGSWEPLSVYARDYAGDDDDDRVYTTAMCVLTLEIYYRYFTPLLKVE
jgi:hypothetical protein